MKRELPASAYLTDGRRSVDFVFTQKAEKEKSADSKHLETQFELALTQNGLQIEAHRQGDMIYMKIHAPFEVLCAQAEKEGMEVPVLPCDITTEDGDKCGPCNVFGVRAKYKCQQQRYFTKPFINSDRDAYLLSPETFTPAQRIYLTHRIIYGTYLEPIASAYSADTGARPVINYENLLKLGVYERAYCVHDADVNEKVVGKQPPDAWPMRVLLQRSWASWWALLCPQPLDYIQEYYGEQVAFYFAWLGFYIRWLTLPAVAGAAVTGLAAWLSLNDAMFFCDPSNEGYFCRPCASLACEYIKSTNLCWAARLSKVIERPVTQVGLGGITFLNAFAFCMVIWANVLLDKWTQYERALAQRWSVLSVSQLKNEKLRPEYLEAVNTLSFNEITQTYEPSLKGRSVGVRLLSSLATVLFLVTVVIGLIVSVVIYKQNAHIVIDTLDWLLDKVTPKGISYYDDKGFKNYHIPPGQFSTFSASLISVLCMSVMSLVYEKVAIYLTRMEMPRTQQQFDNSYTYKLCVFQCVNFYGTLCYLALVRPFIQDNPLTETRLDACPPHGCMYDVAVQLLVIALFKLVLNNVFEFLLPRIRNFITRCRHCGDKGVDKGDRCAADALLLDPDQPILLPDHMELLIQFGFVFLFAAVLPLLPLVALLNNVVELRLDANKLHTQTKRLIPARTKGIGPWLVMLKMFARLSLVTNAFIATVDTNLAGIMLAHLSSSDTSISMQPFNDGNSTEQPALPDATSFVARYDYASRFNTFDTGLWCFHYNGQRKLVNISELAEPFPPTIDSFFEAQGSEQSEYDVNAPFRPLFEGHNNLSYDFDSLYMPGCRDGMVFLHGLRESAVQKMITHQFINATSAGNRSNTDGTTVALEPEKQIDQCWVNADVHLTEYHELITNPEHYRLRYAQFALAVAYILLAAIILFILHYGMPRESRSQRILAERKDFLFRQLLKRQSESPERQFRKAPSSVQTSTARFDDVENVDWHIGGQRYARSQHGSSKGDPSSPRGWATGSRHPTTPHRSKYSSFRSVQIPEWPEHGGGDGNGGGYGDASVVSSRTARRRNKPYLFRLLFKCFGML